MRLFIALSLIFTCAQIVHSSPSQAANTACTKTLTGGTVSDASTASLCVLSITSGTSTFKVPAATTSVNVLLVGGGGSGGNALGGGGGGGQVVIVNSYTVTSSASYSISVGVGGSGTTSVGLGAQYGYGINGGRSSFGALVARGGGGGGYQQHSGQTDGGSTGGNGEDGTSTIPVNSAVQYPATAAGTYSGPGAGYQNAGGVGGRYQKQQGGGGGGAGGAGQSADRTSTYPLSGGAGGAGLQVAPDATGNFIVGSGTYYGAGGGGNGGHTGTTPSNGTGGAGGTGGGGSGGLDGVAGGTATGVGGGGGGSAVSGGGLGAAGIVILTFSAPPTPLNQTITFGSLPATNIYAGNITLGSTSGYSAATTTGTNATVTYSSTSSSSICTVTLAGVITVKGVGTCQVAADAAATSTYNAATQVIQNLVISYKVPDAPTINSVSGGDSSTTIVFTPGRNGGTAITSETITATNTSTNATTTAVITSGTTLVTGSATFPGSDTAVTSPYGQIRYKMTGLTNGQNYTFTVTATNSVGTSAASTASLDVTPAGAPYAVSSLTATAGDGSATLNWVLPASLGGGTWSSYKIYWRVHTSGVSASSGTYSNVATDTTQSDTSYTITGLTNGTAYDFQVIVNTSTSSGGLSSNFTAVDSLIPAAAPNAPTLTISYASSTTVTVAWVAGNSNGSAITGYTLSYTKNGSSTSCSGGNTTTAAGSSCTLTGVAGDDFGATAYATNLIGNSPTVSASFTLIGTAAAPASLVGTPGDGSASIAFTEDSNGDVIIDYLYSLDGGTTFISSGSTSSPLVITGLDNGTAYSIIIQAVGAVNGASASSSSVTVTPAAPAAPASGGGSGRQISVITTIDRTTTSSQSPVVQQGIEAITNHRDVDQYFKNPTTVSKQPTGTTITPGNIQTINSTTAVNTQVVTTTSNKQAVVTISLSTPIITDQAVAALATKIAVASTQTGLTVTPVAGFTGVLVVPVIATVNGVQTTVLNKVVVNPVAPAPQGFAPVDIGKSSVAWTASSSQVTGYQVAINGKAAGTTTASTIALPSLIGPKSKVTVTAIGNDQTASTPIVIPYIAKAPIPALKVNFNSGSALLTPAQKADISGIAKVIDTQGFTRLVVNGFTDAVGSPAANAVLSQARAQAVVAYMKTLLPKVAIKAGANGSANPVADNTTDEGKAQNRRTEIATW